MPVYDYHCDACGNDFEARQKMSDDALTTCTLCGAEGQVQKLLSAGSGLIFKGSGFYITDYKNNNSGAKSESSASSSPSKSESTTTSSSESSTASKPAASSTPSTGGGHSCGSGCGCS